PRAPHQGRRGSIQPESSPSGRSLVRGGCSGSSPSSGVPIAGAVAEPRACSRPDEAGAPAGGATSESGTSAWQKPESQSQSVPSADSTHGSEVSGEGTCRILGRSDAGTGAAAVGAVAGDGASGMPELTSL